jgi:hypothetical protein
MPLTYVCFVFVLHSSSHPLAPRTPNHIINTIMKSYFGLLLALLIGVAIAFIQPARPVQLGKPAFMESSNNDSNNNNKAVGLDNPAIASDGNIHPARKCKAWRDVITNTLLYTIKFLTDKTVSCGHHLGGFCMG